MNIQFDLSKVDFRVTPLENIFLDTYLAGTDGDALRVYFYCWKQCYQQESTGVLLSQIAEALDLTEARLCSIGDFWEGENLLRRHGSGVEECWEMRSMLLSWVGLHDEEERGIASKIPDEQPEELLNEQQRTLVADMEADLRQRGDPWEKVLSQRRRMIEELEHYLSSDAVAFQFNPKELAKIHDFLDTYPIRPAYFAYAYKRAHGDNYRGLKTTDYLLGIIDNWVRQQKLLDEEALDAFLAKPEPKKKRATKKKTVGAFVRQDQRMSKEERREWVKKKLEASRKASLRGEE